MRPADAEPRQAAVDLPVDLMSSTVRLEREGQYSIGSTVLMGGRKSIFLKIRYFHVLTSLLEQKFHTYSKIELKNFHTI